MPTIPGPGETAASRIADPDRETALFRAVLDSVDEAVLVTSTDLEPPGPVIEYANPAAARITGYDAAELLGKSPRLLQGPKTDRAVLERLRADLGQGRRFRGEAVNYRKDGTEYVVEWVVLPLCDDQGEVLHWVSVQRDVTEQRQFEARQQNLTAELNHRVKNTLSTVQAIAGLTLRSTPSPDDFAERFQARLVALSQAHNTLTRSEWTGALLRELLTRELAPFCDDPPDRCSVDGPDVWLPPRIALALSMAFHELATNASRHGGLSAPGGQLHVAWRLSQDGAGRVLYIEARAGRPARIGAVT
jgi:PAS domain S-box-containing protein